MTLIPSQSWSELTPAGSDNVSAGDNRIREMKTQIREVIDVDHDFPSSGQAADVGQHKKVTLQEQANLGTGAEGKPILGAQTVDGKAELVFTDEDDNDIQITSGGKIDLGSGRLDNDEALTARNNAGDGDLNLIKANASDQAVITPALLASGGAILPEITAPTTAANQGAVYTKNDGDQTELYFREESNGDEVQITNGGVINGLPSFGSYDTSTYSNNTEYTAATDGTVVAIFDGTGLQAFAHSCYVGSASASTLIARGWTDDGENTNVDVCTLTFPVKKGWKWKVVKGSTSKLTLTWLPLS